MDKIELTKSEVDQILVRQEIINAKINEMKQKEVEVMICQREGSFYLQDLLKKYNADVNNQEWNYENGFLIKKSIKDSQKTNGDCT